MEATIELEYRRPEPDEVLDALRELQWQFNDGDLGTGEPVDFDTPLEEYLFDAKLVDEQFNPVLNEYFGVNTENKEVAAFLVSRTGPKKVLTLRALCETIAEFGRVPDVRPYRVAGSECLSAGTFLTVRTMLANAGADVSQLAPSSPLEPYFYRYPHVFKGPIAILAPGTLPAMRLRNRLLERFARKLAFAILGVMASIPLIKFLPNWGWPILTESAVMLTLMILACRYAARRRYWLIDLGGLHTFRDLVAALLGRPLPEAPS